MEYYLFNYWLIGIAYVAVCLAFTTREKWQQAFIGLAEMPFSDKTNATIVFIAFTWVILFGTVEWPYYAVKKIIYTIRG